jgi:enoyl-CoA hydratase
MYQTLTTSLDNNIYTVTINRPDKLNALNSEVMNELNLVLDEIDSNGEIRVVILTGAGQKAFVAGADISEFVGVSKEEGQSLAQKGQTIFLSHRK